MDNIIKGKEYIFVPREDFDTMGQYHGRTFVVESIVGPFIFGFIGLEYWPAYADELIDPEVP